MKIIQEPFLDKSEQDEDGFYEYYYEGNNYEIVFDQVTYWVRSYTDEPTHLYISNRKVQEIEGHTFSYIPYEEETFWQLIKHFKNLGFKTFAVITSQSKNGYENIDLEKFTRDV